jgi:hypothetical protein
VLSGGSIATPVIPSLLGSAARVARAAVKRSVAYLSQSRMERDAVLGVLVSLCSVGAGALFVGIQMSGADLVQLVVVLAIMAGVCALTVVWFPQEYNNETNWLATDQHPQPPGEK